MRRNGIIIGAVVVVIIALVAVFGWQTMTANAAATTSHLQTATVQPGTLVATVNAAGNVSAPQSAAISFQTSGVVAQVNVQVGDSVKKGQVLMKLDTSDLELALKSAQANLASAQANYDANTSNLQDALKTAQANLASAQANYDSVKAKDATNADQLMAAKAALDKAAAAVQQAQAAYDKIGGASNPAIGMTSQSLALQQATDDYQSALATYKVTASGINDTALRAAQAQVDAAQVAVDQAQHNLVNSTRTAQATLEAAQIAVEQAQSNLAKASIVAPFDGVVSAVNYAAGDTTGSGSNAAVTVVNPSDLEVQVTVAEVDMPKIKLGETAQMTLDAVPGKTYNAKVVRIDPVGTITQGVVNYPITVAITDPDSSIAPGMTANLNVVVDQRQNVLMIPLRAVHTQGNQKTATVLYKDQTIQAPITTGLANDQYVEVTSGLRAGDVVVLNQTQTQTRGGLPGFGGGFIIGR